MKKMENFSDFENKSPDIRKMEYYENKSRNDELKKEFCGVWNASALYCDIQKNQQKFPFYTPVAKQEFLKKINKLQELKEYMPKEAIEKMKKTTQNIEKQLSNKIRWEK